MSLHAEPAPSPASPPFRADHVGSFLRPPALKDATAKARTGDVDPAELKAIQDAAIRDVVKMQEAAGLPVVTDGEFRHTSFHHFLEKVDGTSVSRPNRVAGAAQLSFEPRTYAITGKLRHRTPIEVEAFRYVSSLTDRTVKVTLASPTMLLRAGREAISEEAYPDLAAFYDDIAAVYRAEIAALSDAGCSYVQLDDTNYAYLCDPALRARRQLGGTDPDALAHRYAELINAAIADRPAGMTACIHICRGNSAGSFAAIGGYEPIADVLLNKVAVDGYFLEYDDARSGGFDPLRFLPKGSAKKIVLGLLTTKSSKVETIETLKRRIDEATRFVPLENLCLSPQCGFASTFEGNPVSFEVERQKLEVLVEAAQEVWGSTV